ncbi:MAG: neutral zinc metallopeptidase [Acidobacteria bacterium]|nr:neutral zinc metallopeptidase [Acidobacteriota bacterium]
MEWSPGGMSGDVEDRRGESGGGGFGFGGGGGLGILGVIVLVVISLVTGRNYIGAYLSGGGAPVQQSRQMDEGPVQESASEHRSAQLVSYVLDDAQKTWTQVLPEQAGKQYRHAKLVLFRDMTYSGCGNAQAATGPFYCPADEKVYIDLDFWNELKRIGGDAGDFAQAYVVAHELGHHVQKIVGTEARVRQGMRSDPSQQNALSVRLELQADCYAGIWGHETRDRSKVNSADIEDALKAAAAVGDDHLQKMEGRAVSPESWTHGSSAQRIAWFRRGFESGEMSQCNTFSTN